MQRVRAAIVGCGRVSDLHEIGYRGRPEASIVAVCDTTKRRARNKARAWGVEKVYDDYEQVLADPEIDLVEVLVPHHLHASMAMAACEAGKHVSVQKPMALTVAEARAMIEAAERNGVRLRVYENFVFYPPIVRAKEMIEAGEIGEPQMIRIHYNSGSRSSGWNVPLGAWLWRFDEGRCGGGPIVFDHGYHLFSVAHFLMGEVERVRAWIDRSRVIPTTYVDAPATVMIKFKGEGRYGVMDFSHTPGMRIESDYYVDDNRVEIVGDKGILFVNRGTTKTVDLPALMLFRDGRTLAVPVEGLDWAESFVACTGQMIDALIDGREPVLSGETGMKVLQVALAVIASAREGREVNPDEVG